MDEKRRSVRKLYVGGRSRELLDALVRSMVVEGGITKLTSVEREEYETSIVERGSTASGAVMEVALLSLLARLTDRWPGGDPS